MAPLPWILEYATQADEQVMDRIGCHRGNNSYLSLLRQGKSIEYHISMITNVLQTCYTEVKVNYSALMDRLFKPSKVI